MEKAAGDGHPTHIVVMDLGRHLTQSLIQLLQELQNVLRVNAHLVNCIHDRYPTDNKQAIVFKGKKS